jgi:hypothetical protein
VVIKIQRLVLVHFLIQRKIIEEIRCSGLAFARIVYEVVADKTIELEVVLQMLLHRSF